MKTKTKDKAKTKGNTKTRTVPTDVREWQSFFRPLCAQAKRSAERRNACPSCQRGNALMYLVHMGSRMAEICMHCDYSAAHRVQLEVVPQSKKTA